VSDRNGSVEEARRLADEAMANIESAALRPPPPPTAGARAQLRRRVTLIGLALGVPILTLQLIQNFSEGGVRGLVSTLSTETTLRHRLLETMSGVVTEIETFREDYDELPENLAEVAAPFEGQWRYELVERGRYRIALSRWGQSVTFDSADDPEVIFGAVRQP
jgi:hypothetical protein